MLEWTRFSGLLVRTNQGLWGNVRQTAPGGPSLEASEPGSRCLWWRRLGSKMTPWNSVRRYFPAPEWRHHTSGRHTVADWTWLIVWFFQSAVVKFNDRRPVAEQINQLYFAVFQWRDPYIQQNKMVSFPGCLVSSCQSCKAGFLLPNRSWRLIPGAPSPFCLGFSWLCSRLLILPNSPFSG